MSMFDPVRLGMVNQVIPSIFQNLVPSGLMGFFLNLH